jgi:arsenate reductase (thioredoxin)
MDGKKVKLLFVCIENARRSQMAAGFAEAYGEDRVVVYSAGSRPGSAIDPMITQVMEEKGIDLSSRRPKALADLPVENVDYLISMGCEETCPAFSAKKIEDWGISDPKGKPIEFVREVRDTIEKKVKTLLEEAMRR